MGPGKNHISEIHTRMSSNVDFFDKRWQTFFSTCLNFPATKKLKNKRDLTQIAKPNLENSKERANLGSFVSKVF